MAWAQAIVQLFQVLGAVINWWHESSDEKKKAKGEVIKEITNAKTQEDMRKLINDFNSI